MNQRTYKAIPFNHVTIDDIFWSKKRDLNREHTIQAIYNQCKDTGRIDSFRLEWKEGEPAPHVFWDSDVAKWIEAASYSLATHPDAELEELVDETIDLVVFAQQPDGYLNTYFTVVEPEKRWTDLRDAHELYCAGHLMEAAVAHFESTGKRKLLDAVCRYADHIAQVFGSDPNQKPGYCGHPEIELALVRLYKATHNERYLELSRFFVDERGKSPNYFDMEREERGGTASYFDSYFQEPGKAYTHEYNQSHMPVREQDQVTGHSVRAMYLYSAMVDLAVAYGDESLLKACGRLWQRLTERHMYITAGIGPSHDNEGFTKDYELPNQTAYCETCASVGLVFWNHRLLHADLDACYADLIEQALYNGVICGVSNDGKKFFYDNPLASKGTHHRQEWFEVSCCPANLSRLLSTLGQYIYSEGESEIFIHQYIQSSTEIHVSGDKVKLDQQTNYPWEGNVAITVNPNKKSTFTIQLRLPGWCAQAKLLVNGQSVPVTSEKGYVSLHREWQEGDLIEWCFDMPIQRVYAHPNVEVDRGRVVIRRGPIIFCLEEVDNGKDLNGIYLPKDAELVAVYDEHLLGGVTKIQGTGQRYKKSDWDGKLYRTDQGNMETVSITAIPYFSWDNRDHGEMLVWIREK